MQHFFVAGIDTNAGKTIVSAILTEALQADYWKPVQAGETDNTDTMKVQALVANTTSKFHKETFLLSRPMSPHIAAAKDHVTINLSDIIIPDTQNNLIVEGAGGLLVPLNNDEFVIDLAKKLDIPVILVSRHYLGSINHTLLSALALKQKNIKVAGIIFNGEEIEGTEEIILAHTGYTCLGHVYEEEFFDRETISRYATEFSKTLNHGA